MLYPYRCPICGAETEIYKPAAESGANELCPQCHVIMTRVWTVPQTIIRHSAYNPGLGAVDDGTGSALRSVNQKRADEGKSELIPVPDGITEQIKHNNYELSRNEHQAIQRMIDA